MHPVFFEFLGDPTKNRVGVTFLESSGKGHHPQIKTQVFEQVRRGDPASHNGLVNVRRGKRADQFVELADLDPGHRIGMLLDRVVGFTLKRHGNNPSRPALTGRASGKNRELTVPRDNPERFH